jgi:hypothetical protein
MSKGRNRHANPGYFGHMGVLWLLLLVSAGCTQRFGPYVKTIEPRQDGSMRVERCELDKFQLWLPVFVAWDHTTEVNCKTDVIAPKPAPSSASSSNP